MTQSASFATVSGAVASIRGSVRRSASAFVMPLMSLLPAQPALAVDLPVYAVVRSPGFPRIPELGSHRCITGLTLYFSWRELEPGPGRYQFELLDGAVEQVLRQGMKVSLAVLPGRWSPAWLKDTGMGYMSWSHSDSYVEDGKNRAATSPIPWHPVFLDRFSEFVRALERHLRAKAYPVNSIAITGPSNTNGLELAVVGGDNDLKQAGFTDAAFVAAWKRMIDAYASMPAPILTLALHDQIGPKRRADLARQISAYARSRLGARYVPMLLAFEGKSWFNSGNPYAGLMLKADSAADGALQMIKIFSNGQRRDEFDQSMRRAEVLRPQWLEIWQEDVKPGYLECR